MPSLSTFLSTRRYVGVMLLVCASFLVNACGLIPSRESMEMREMRNAARGKNLVMILLDAAGYSHFGFSGYERNTTPIIDALAVESLVFDTAYSEAASTGHSVYAMLTSSYPFLAEKEGLKGSDRLRYEILFTFRQGVKNWILHYLPFAYPIAKKF